MITATREIHSCEVCGNERLLPVLDLGLHPMCDDLVRIGDSRQCVEYPIDILFCEHCRTAHQHFQVPKQELFPSSYHYRSRFTADVLFGMAALVDSCEQTFGSLAGKRVVDVGCNDGSLLDAFRRKGAKTIGIEPTDACLDAKASGHAVYHGFLSEEVAGALVVEHGQPDFVTFTNVFAHIEHLDEVFASVRRLLAPRTVVVIENHYLGSIFQGSQFDTFYHEHPRSYSYTSFAHMARSLDRTIVNVEFPSRYGGNIRVFLAASDVPVRTSGSSLAAVEERERNFIRDFAAMRRDIDRWREVKGAAIADHVRQHGPWRAKAFPGRAAILIKLLGIDENSISAVHEKPGSLKIGHYVPGTRIPIRSDDELFAMKDQDAPLLNLAWHIPGEIRSYLTSHGYRGPVVDIANAGDFDR